jgi:hypothetical protein
MATRPKTGGRKKGTPNKLTATAREAISFAANKMGGGERLYEWAISAPENERAFWTSIYPKLVPIDVNASGGFAVTLQSDVKKL